MKNEHITELGRMNEVSVDLCICNNTTIIKNNNINNNIITDYSKIRFLINKKTNSTYFDLLTGLNCRVVWFIILHAPFVNLTSWAWVGHAPRRILCCKPNIPIQSFLSMWAFVSDCSQISSPSLVNNNGTRVNRVEEGVYGQAQRDLNSTRRGREPQTSHSQQQQQQRRGPALSLHGLVG